MRWRMTVLSLFVRLLMKCNRSRVSKQHNERLNAPTKNPEHACSDWDQLTSGNSHGNLTVLLRNARPIPGFQSSQIVSRSRSPRRSAPQTLHRFRLSLEPTPKVLPRTGTSRPVRLFESPLSAASAAALSWAILSASKAASSASGVSGIVSRLEILGLLDRIELGVDGTEEDG